MKKLEILEMEVVEGGFDIDFWGGVSCAGALLLGAGLIYGSGGLGAGVALNVAAAGCGAYIGSQA